MARLLVATILTGPVSIVFAVCDTPIPVAARAFFGVVTIIVAWSWIRLPWVGVWKVDSETVGSRSWFTPFRAVSLSDIERFRAVEYFGALYVLGWTFPSGRLQSGQVAAVLKNGDTRVLRGSVTGLLTAKAQCRELNDWLGVEQPREGRRRNDEPD